MLIHILQHVAHEGPGRLADWAAARGHELRLYPVFAAPHALPALAPGEGVGILGGPMSVHDEAALPWLRAEKAFIRAAVAAGGPVLGICLGAQLLAEALGGEVLASAELEIGWFPVQLSGAAQLFAPLVPAPAGLPVLHWHGETFTLPPGALPLGRSAACATQGFRRERGVGIQFHPEVDADLLADMLHHESHELAGGGRFVQTAKELTAGLAAHGAGAQAWLFGVLDELFGEAEVARTL